MQHTHRNTVCCVEIHKAKYQGQGSQSAVGETFTHSYRKAFTQLTAVLNCFQPSTCVVLRGKGALYHACIYVTVIIRYQDILLV